MLLIKFGKIWKDPISHLRFKSKQEAVEKLQGYEIVAEGPDWIRLEEKYEIES